MSTAVSNDVIHGQARNEKVNKWLAERQPTMLINNKMVPAESGRTFDTINPATGAAKIGRFSATGAASQTNAAEGAATLGPFKAAGDVTQTNTAEGATQLGPLTAGACARLRPTD